MNIYARFFESETLAHNVEELLDFLRGLQDFNITVDMEEDIRNYINSDIRFPRRYKIRPRIYFILIKTNAASMEEFKANNKSSNQPEQMEMTESASEIKEQKLATLMEENKGWYHCTLNFKRVLPVPGTMKFQYQDTCFEVCVKASNGQECYNRIISHLQSRSDIDTRSQFPSAKGNNFVFEFLGEEKPELDMFPVEANENTTNVNVITE